MMLTTPAVTLIVVQLLIIVIFIASLKDEYVHVDKDESNDLVF